MSEAVNDAGPAAGSDFVAAARLPAAAAAAAAAAGAAEADPAAAECSIFTLLLAEAEAAALAATEAAEAADAAEEDVAGSAGRLRVLDCCRCGEWGAHWSHVLLAPCSLQAGRLITVNGGGREDSNSERRTDQSRVGEKS